jgi:hypothetical protein
MKQSAHKFVALLGDFEKLRALRVDPTKYSKTGMTTIATYLRAQGYTRDNALPLGFMPFIDAKSGKIATRIAKLVEAQTGQKLSAKDKEEIGNIASRYVSREEDVLYDFHDGVLDWPSGDFGNSGSCWRNSYTSSVPMLREGTGHGPGFAMRLFTTETSRNVRGQYYGGVRGYGRMWLLPWEDGLIVFNPYGQKIEWFTDRLIKIMSENTHETLFAESVKMSNADSGLYANGGSSAIITAGEPYSKRSIETRMPRYLTKTCFACRKKYARKPGEEASSSEGYCHDCGAKCAVTKEIGKKVDMIPVKQKLRITHNRITHTVTEGYIKPSFKDQLIYCVDCVAFVNEGCEHD